ncbi:sulfatase-like hydrolase/transferase, partial [Pseudomonas protegens]|uniref:LTA synthase family protein n=1 Tax=Pseudomonas protegens TaxID=380021 RepID=UPI00315856F3
MGGLQSRRLRYGVGAIGLVFGLLALLRLLFAVGFSEVDLSAADQREAILQTLGIGLRFDLRLTLLILLPLALLAWLPRWNLLRLPTLRWLARVYLLLVLGGVGLLYIIDFGHYAYLGVRINATVLRYLDDAQISRQMLWESYPVLWIVLAWGSALSLWCYALLRLERLTLDRPAQTLGRWSLACVSALGIAAVFLALLGRVENLNLENPVPLRWSDAYFSGNSQIAALGLNPVLFFYDTLKAGQAQYDEAQVRQHYPALARYLGVDHPDPQRLSFTRQQGVQPYRIDRPRPPNVIFVMLESLGTSAVGAYGNPLNPTPNLDRLASQSWFFKHFYVPVTGTAKTVWASITGVPDVTRQETATRQPLITRQHSLINAFSDYHRLYLIGGNAGWANINGLIRQSIDNVRLYDESHWQSPQVDVWGISDLDLFKESDRLLRAIPRDQPFFAYLQTSGNHRPFTIPKDNDGFQTQDLPLEQVQAAGSRSLAQYNAVRLLDFNIGRLMEIAKAGGYYDNTIFVFFGDHNTRIS